MCILNVFGEDPNPKLLSSAPVGVRMCVNVSVNEVNRLECSDRVQKSYIRSHPFTSVHYGVRVKQIDVLFATY